VYCYGVLTSELLAAKPGVFQSMTGVSPKEFQALLAQVDPRYQAMVRSRVERADRKRAPGAGAKSRHDVADRLLMTLIWLRFYLTCEAVGFLFGVDKGTVSRFTRPILLILRDIGVDTLGWPEEALELTKPATGEPEDSGAPPSGPPPDPPLEINWPTDPAEDEETLKKSEAETVVTPDQSRCSDRLAIVDATEQRVERAKEYETQKKYYSGKKKTHTIKTQIVVNEHGRIRDVRNSVPGSTHDLTLLRESGVKDELPEGLTITADTGYRGLQNDFPDRSVALPYRPKDKQKLMPEERLHNHFLSSLRIVIENTLCEMKHFQALVARFRHSLERHCEVIKAIVGIVNLRIDNRLATLAIPSSTGP
jgi:transposase